MKRFNKKRKQKKKIFNITILVVITLAILFYLNIINEKYNNKTVEIQQNTKINLGPLCHNFNTY